MGLQSEVVQYFWDILSDTVSRVLRDVLGFSSIFLGVFMTSSRVLMVLLGFVFR